MKQFSFAVTLSFFVFFACACGTNAQRQLESITVTPASAASNEPVQFTATGHYNTSPSTATPKNLSWGVCVQTGNEEMPTTNVTINQTGIAQCNQNAAGNYLVWANAPILGNNPTCEVMTPCGDTCGTVKGTAQLTCGMN